MNHESILKERIANEVSPILETLAKVKQELGFRSARAFYDQYLKTRTRLDFNYSYYMKIEGGKIVPSAAIISNLCAALEESSAQELMLSYCEVIFPERAQVFKRSKSTPKIQPKKEVREIAGAQAVAVSQTSLTDAQVAGVSQSKVHYFVFLLLTLARRPVKVSELKTTLGKHPTFGEKQLQALLCDFVKLKLIKRESDVSEDEVTSIANEMKFPAADTPALKARYDQMDIWNTSFNHEMNFDSVIQKMMVRRVSSRYLNVIQNHCNVLIDLIRASDEIDSEYNDDVVMFNVSIQRGHLPG